MHLVGRDSALASLASALARADGGRSVLVLVEGAPGMGKTALFGHFLSSVSGRRVVRAAGLESEALVRYGLAGSLLRTMDDVAAVRPDDDATQVGGRLLAALSHDSGPTVLVVDDAQWADVVSLQALMFALRRLETDSVATIIGTRGLAESPDVLARLVEAAQGETIRLAPLTPAAVADLARQHSVTLSSGAARRLHRHTGGLPLHLVALLSELSPDELARTQATLPAPRSFAGLIQRRLSAGPPDLRRLVAAAAVLPDPVHVGLAAEVGQVADPVVALDAAVRMGLVEHRRESGGDFVRFTHDLVRAAVLDGLTPATRLGLHRRAAELLPGVAALEQRAAAAILPDANLCDELSKLAHDEAEAGATESAVHHLLEASRLCPDARVARDRRLDAVEALLLAGATASAKELAAELHDDLADPADPARTLYLRGHLALLDGRRTDAEHLLLDAWEWCEPDARPRLAALIAAQLAQLFVADARNAETAIWAQRVMRHAGDDARLATTATAALLAALVFSGAPDAAAARALPEPATEPALRAGRFDDVVGRGLVRLWTDDLAGARADLTAVANRLDPGRPLRVRLLALAYLAEVEFRSGHWDDSLAASELAVSLAADADHPWLSGLLNGVAALPWAARGEWETAATYVAAGRAASAIIDDTMNLVYPASASCLLAVAKADHAAVLAVTAPLTALTVANGSLEPGVMQWCPYRVDALVATGALAEAEALLSLAEPLARTRGRRSTLVALARGRAAYRAALGEMTAATRTFEDAVELLPDLPMPFEAGLLRLAYGSHLRRTGQRRSAGEQLRQAVDLFDALGAAPFAERGRAELAACGLSPRRRGPALPTLTPREHAVARLVADGLTNREIAERLVISVKTAEYHLGNVYAKLGIRSRTQLAATLGRVT